MRSSIRLFSHHLQAKLRQPEKLQGGRYTCPYFQTMYEIKDPTSQSSAANQVVSTRGVTKEPIQLLRSLDHVQDQGSGVSGVTVKQGCISWRSFRSGDTPAHTLKSCTRTKIWLRSRQDRQGFTSWRSFRSEKTLVRTSKSCLRLKIRH